MPNADGGRGGGVTPVIRKQDEPDAAFDGLIAGLEIDGWAVALNGLPDAMIDGLVARAKAGELDGRSAAAGVGRRAGHQASDAARVTSSAWLDGSAWGLDGSAGGLDGSAEAERSFLAFAERLRLAINERLYLGLFEFEAQFLSYPPGGFYKRHIDSLHGSRNRIVSLVAYLNRGWHAEDGGALVVWQPGNNEEKRFEVQPEAGTVVLMMSEDIPHEAQPALVHRRAIAGWYRVNASTAGRTDPAR